MPFDDFLAIVEISSEARRSVRSHRPKYGGASNAFRVYTLLCLRRETGNASKRVATLLTPAGGKYMKDPFVKISEKSCSEN